MPVDQEALSGLQASFAADGYTLDVTEEAGRLKAVVSVARDDACAECLVPADILSAIMGQILAVPSTDIDITYPEAPDE